MLASGNTTTTSSWPATRSAPAGASSTADASAASRGSSTCPPTAAAALYVIEPDLTSTAELKAIVADYVEQAARWDAPPAEPLCPRDGITRPSSDDHTARRGKSPRAGDAQPA
jgi:hypothetical protein